MSIYLCVNDNFLFAYSWNTCLNIIAVIFHQEALIQQLDYIWDTLFFFPVITSDDKAMPFIIINFWLRSLSKCAVRNSQDWANKLMFAWVLLCLCCIKSMPNSVDLWQDYLLRESLQWGYSSGDPSDFMGSFIVWSTDGFGIQHRKLVGMVCIADSLCSEAIWLAGSQCYRLSIYLIYIYCEISNIRNTIVGEVIGDHSNVVGASPVSAAPTTSSFST